MVNKQSGSGSGLGNAAALVKGAAALVKSVALLVVVCIGVGLFFKRGPEAQVQTNPPQAHAPENGAKLQPLPPQPSGSREAWAARRKMFDSRRVALKVKCRETRADVFSHGELTFESADQHLDKKRYDMAMEGFKKADNYYRECAKVG